MRSNPSTAMQKTYDECFLTCSTAVYFESQNNEAEALRSWKNALDQIYYHNAYRVPSNYRPRTETEKALHDSLRQLELQCKERVDLLEALKQSREEAPEKATSPPNPGSAEPSTTPATMAPLHASTSSSSGKTQDARDSTWLGGGTIPPVAYGDLCRPPLPHRPALPARNSSGSGSSRQASLPQPPSISSLSPAAAGSEKKSRTPSPEKRGRMLRTLRPGGKESRPSSSKLPSSMRSRPPAAAKAATQAWGSNSVASSSSNHLPPYSYSASKDSLVIPQVAASRSSFDKSGAHPDLDGIMGEPPSHESYEPKAPFYFRSGDSSSTSYITPHSDFQINTHGHTRNSSSHNNVQPKSPSHINDGNNRVNNDFSQSKSSNTKVLAYRNEYPPISGPRSKAYIRSRAGPDSNKDLPISRKPAPPPPRKTPSLQATPKIKPRIPIESLDTETVGEDSQARRSTRLDAKDIDATTRAELPPTPTSEGGENFSDAELDQWQGRVKSIMKNLPRGVDKTAAQQILNEIVIQGDEVYWDDVAGLDIAKSALKETVVYPFLRPDLFMGLREPARGMLLFGPPGTGKTMLARAVATESRSTFFAISASSLTSKFLGESEKLVRALFSLAKMLAPSIIFVDEIDSLLSSRSGTGEHEATRRIKTEFLIQWSDLAKAAAGREQSEKDKERGDASRVLVLAATNLPWAIDEAARRRFVRRQYIPLPEDHVRKSQLMTLLSHQKHELDDKDMDQLVTLTEGFSGSDITALAKDAAMGPLRSLGEKLLHMTMDEIRPICFDDFKSSLKTIRPSVSKQGLKDFEDWAKEFGERGG